MTTATVTPNYQEFFNKFRNDFIKQAETKITYDFAKKKLEEIKQFYASSPRFVEVFKGERGTIMTFFASETSHSRIRSVETNTGIDFTFYALKDGGTVDFNYYIATKPGDFE